MKVKFLRLIILPSLLGLIPSQVKSDIYSFEQSSGTSSEVSPTYWTFDLPSFGTYSFATWFSQRFGTTTDANNGDPWLHLFQGSTQVKNNDDGGRTAVFNLSEGSISGLESASDASGVSSLINYNYSSGSSTHTLLLGNFP